MFTMLILCVFAIFMALVGTVNTLPTSRIVGGIDAYDGQFPHQISLQRTGSLTCGGSIISRNFILTAAHCVGSETELCPATEFTIRAGSNDWMQGGVVIQVAEIIAHENYGNFLNDVALLRLEKPLDYSKNIQPVALATKEVPPGEPVIISGWGLLKHNGDLPQRLQWNTLTAISTEDCKSRIGWNSDSLICLLHEANHGACHGDSGGPALYEGKLVGIAGFVNGGCGTSNPDGYTKVLYHKKWILEHSDL